MRTIKVLAYLALLFAVTQSCAQTIRLRKELNDYINECSHNTTITYKK